MHDNTTILNLLKTGNSNGMKMLFERYYRFLVLFADNFMHDVVKSEDLVQEQFIKFWENNLFMEIHANALSTYLLTMTRHACLNLLEQKSALQEKISSHCLEIAVQEIENLDERTLQLVQHALNQLPMRTRKVVCCVICDGLSYAETANQLGVSINTIKTLLKNGMKKLREDLKNKKDILVFFLYSKMGLIDRQR